jgi:hypothetical protein
MTRNRALRLLALLASLFVITPLAAGTGAIILALTGHAGGLLALFAIFWTWALLTLLLGNCLIAVWGDAQRQLPPPPLPAAPPVRRAVPEGTTRAELERRQRDIVGLELVSKALARGRS